MKKIITVIGLALSLSVNSLAQASEPQDMGLTMVLETRADVAYLNVDQDFSKYDSIAIVDIDTSDVTIKEPSRSSVHRSNWEMDGQRQERVKNMHRKAFEREFVQANGLEMVDQVDANTLVLATRLAKVAPAVDYDPQRIAGRVEVISNSTGSAVIEMLLLDGETGEVVAAVATARELGGHYWKRNNAVTNGSDVQMAFNAWAKQAREAVENLPSIAADAQS